MRDPARIDPLLDKLREAWIKEPDLRLAQLIVIAVKPKTPCPDVFYTEDDKLLKGLEDYLELLNKRND
jgi:hypothetical protein